MKVFIQIITLFLLTQKCFGQYSSIDTTYYLNGQIDQINMTLEGDSIIIKKKFYSQYLKFEHGVFLLGEKKEDKIESIKTFVVLGHNVIQQDGYSEYYYENGNKKLEVIYSKENGGRYLNQWDKNSIQILKSGNGIHTKLDIGISALDSLVYEVKDSLLHGKFVRYAKDENGEYYVREIQNYEYNKPTGSKQMFKPNGKLLLREKYLNRPDSVLYELFYENGQVKEVGVKLDDRRIGMWIYYTNDGIKEKEIEYKENQKNGIYRAYHRNGTIKEKGNYTIIMQASEVSHFDPETYEETKYIEDVETSVKDGKWIYFDERGIIEKMEYYHSGRLKKVNE